MQRKDTSLETSTVKALQAGSLTTLVRQRLGPALFQESGIVVESKSGHSVALATDIKTGRERGDVYLSADAQVNQLLLGPSHDHCIQRTALHFVEYLLSPAGQQHVRDAHFLPGPALVGGDLTAIPHQLRPVLLGEYHYPG